MNRASPEFTNILTDEILTSLDTTASYLEQNTVLGQSLLSSAVGRIAETGRVHGALFEDPDNVDAERLSMWQQLEVLQETGVDDSNASKALKIHEILSQYPNIDYAHINVLTSRFRKTKTHKAIKAHHTRSTGGFSTADEALHEVHSSLDFLREIFYAEAASLVAIYTQPGSTDYQIDTAMKTIETIGKLLSDPYGSDLEDLIPHLNYTTTPEKATYKDVVHTTQLRGTVKCITVPNKWVVDVCVKEVAEQKKSELEHRAVYRALVAECLSVLPVYHTHRYSRGSVNQPWIPAEQWQRLEGETVRKLRSHLNELPQDQTRAICRAISQSIDLKEILAHYDNPDVAWLKDMEATGQEVAGSSWFTKP